MSSFTSTITNQNNNNMEDEMTTTTTNTNSAAEEWFGIDRGALCLNTTVVYGGLTWDVAITKRSRYGERSVYTRLFIDTPEAFDAIATANHPVPTGAMFPDARRKIYGNDATITYEPFDADQACYTSRGDDVEVDKAWDRHNKAQVAAWQEVLRQVDHHTHVGKSRFSRKAGCSCPCSPGFVAANHRHGSFWITVVGVAA
jgi:hypothetical protein